MKIACGFDHAGVALRETAFSAIAELRLDAVDLGTASGDPVDYPDIAASVCEAITTKRAHRGVIICGSGAGASIAACKFKGIRAATVHDTYTAHQCVEHDDVNVLCLGGRVIGCAYAAEIIKTFLVAKFSGDDRHRRRLQKIAQIENSQ